MDEKTDLINKIIELQEAITGILHFDNPVSVSTRRHFYNNFKISRLQEIYDDLILQMARMVSR